MVIQGVGEPGDLRLASVARTSSASVAMAVVQDCYMRAKPEDRAIHVRKTRKGSLRAIRKWERKRVE